MNALKNPKTNKYFQGYTLDGEIIESETIPAVFENSDSTAPVFIPDIGTIKADFEVVEVDVKIQEQEEIWKKLPSDGLTPGGNPVYYCLKCGWVYGSHSIYPTYRYCPNCGNRNHQTYPKHAYSPVIMENEVVVKTNSQNLVGYEEGWRLYEEQIEDAIDLTDTFWIRFPDTVQCVSTSFIQGIISPMVKEAGIVTIRQNININTTNPRIEEKFLKELGIQK